MKLKDAGKYPEALARAEQALTEHETLLGAAHPDVASCLLLVGNLHRLQGHFPKAEPYLQRAHTLFRAALGEKHPHVAQALHTLALLDFDRGAYAQAKTSFERALALREAALGPNHPDIAQSLNDLANLDYMQGKYPSAERHFGRALALREATLGPNHPDIAQSLNDLGVVYWEQGKYPSAERHFERALAIYTTVRGPNHPDTAQLLSNIATLYFLQGMYDRAEPLLERALELQTDTLGLSHPTVANSLSNLAAVYVHQGKYTSAKELYERALRLREATLSARHPHVAAALRNLATLYVTQKDYNEAEILLKRALDIHTAAPGESPPDFARTLNNLAVIYKERGMYDQSEDLYKRALTLREATLSEDNPEVVVSLESLARLHLTQHRLDDALPNLTRSISISEKRLRKEALGFSESRLSQLLHSLREQEETLYVLSSAHAENPRVRNLALAAALLFKGRSVEETAQVSRTIYQHLGPEDRDTFERLRGLRTQLANLSYSSANLPEEQFKALISAGDALETQLARNSGSLRAQSNLPGLHEIVERVAASLPHDGALVEFIAYRSNPRAYYPGMRPSEERDDSLHYLALVLFPDGTTRAVDLGPAERIHQATTRLRDDLKNQATSVQDTAHALYELVFKPLQSLLGSTRRLWLSPDGQLSLVPFAALHDGQDYLLASFHFTYLTSGRELLPRVQDSTTPSSVVVFADPDFQAPVNTAAPPDTSSGAPLDDLKRYASTLRSKRNMDSLTPLPGTRLEAQAIQRLWPQAQLFLGAEATKEHLLQVPTPGVLHLATHGFFLESIASAPPPKSDKTRAPHSDTPGGSPIPDPKHPLLRSGIFLAGAGAPAPDDAMPTESSLPSSVVSALELTGLNLWGTQLVVLSACDTGRGKVELGQGIQGLRRALVVAGAETIVMSLWKVSDDSTHRLMGAYYRNLFAGQGRASALHEAMRELRTLRPHPYHWAPF
ncbi:MAG: tetratricopeptide repeat protein, partial [Cystobacter sp.]